MKPSEQQDQLLRDYLKKILHYQETYEEVYDHIVSALAHQETIDNFEAVVNRIIVEDFGGHNQLKKLERTAKKSAVKNTVNSFWQYYLGYFKWPLLPITLGIGMLIYFTLAKAGMNSWVLRGQPLITMIPFYLTVARFFKVGYVSGKVKESVRDSILLKIARVPIWVSILCSMIYIIPLLNGHHHFWDYTYSNTLVNTTLYVLMIVWFLSIIKLYRNDFKVNTMTGN